MIVQHPAYKTAQMCVVSPSLLLHKYPGLKHFWTKPRMWPYSGIMSSEPWRGRSTLSAYRPELQPLQSNEMYDLLMTEIFYALKDYQSILNNSNPKQPTSVSAGPDFICYVTSNYYYYWGLKVCGTGSNEPPTSASYVFIQIISNGISNQANRSFCIA